MDGFASLREYVVAIMAGAGGAAPDPRLRPIKVADAMFAAEEIARLDRLADRLLGQGKGEQDV